MTKKVLTAVAVFATLALAPQAHANQSVGFMFSGGGISGSGVLTFSPDSSGANPITGISGTFSDLNLGITNVPITGIVPINPSPPAGVPPFPASLSFLTVTNPPPFDTAISYDNVFYPDGSPITCPDYPFFGGVLDVYGMLFSLGNGDLVDLWSNGDDGPIGAVPLSYGAIVVDTTSTVIDNVGGGIAFAVPEPSSLWLLGAGLLGALPWRRRTAASRATTA